jgi:nucleotide-binding universal stress UspA family protein
MTPWDYLAAQKEIALVNVARGFFVGGGIMILIGGLISTMSALNATVYSSSRVAFAMGRDRNFPTFFSKVHSKNFTPYWGIAGALTIVIVMAVSLPIEDVASAADIMFLLLFLQVNLAMIKLRKKRPDLDRGFFVPFFPYLSILGIAMLLFLSFYMLEYSLTAWIVTIIWISLGLMVYKFYAASREVEHIRKVKALERIEKKEYNILVCLSNNRTVKSLTNIALAVAKKHQGEIIFLNVVEVGEGQKLMSALDTENSYTKLLEKAEEFTANSEIKTRSIVKVSHRISQGIVDTAIEENCNFIIAGRQKNPDFFQRVFSSLVDTVLHKAPSEVAILHGDLKDSKIKKILIPFASDAHTRLATEIAPSFIEFYKARLEILIVFDPESTEFEREKRLTEINKVMKEDSLKAKVSSIVSKDILSGIVRGSRGVDLILMGGRSGDFLELMFKKSLAQEITEEVKCPVLWVKEYEERPSFWSTIFKPYKKDGE